jgi:hypothetical protein
MSKPPRHCIFCGQKGASKEHLWASWISEVLPPRRMRVGSEHPISMMGGRQMRGMLERPGDILSRKLRVVCRPCNNGWMSGLQAQAKGPLSKLLLDDWSSLNASDYPAIASWIVMTAMVGEQAAPHLVATTPEIRLTFMRERSPPDGWAIWIGRYPGEFFVGGVKPAMAHRGGCLAYKPPAKGQPVKCNTLSVSGCVGSFYFRVAGSTFAFARERIANAASTPPWPLIRIWPSPTEPPDPVPTMSKKVVDTCVFDFQDALFGVTR